jgi:hypothetical protein
VFGNVMYQLGWSRNSADSALALRSDSRNLDADWGPAANDTRHRVIAMVSAPVMWGARANLALQASSAAPYSITTGRDDNGDTVLNGRPSNVGPNSARGTAQIGANLRLSRTFSLRGQAPDGLPGPMGGGMPGPQPAVLAGRAGPGGPGGAGPPGLDGAAGRFRLEWCAQISNVTNHTNLRGFVGNQLSPFYGQAASAGPARKVETGLNFTS